MSKIDEKAYLMVSKDAIGVTDDAYDFPELIKKLEPGEVLKIEAGYKGPLLDKEATILRFDAVINAHGENNILLPIRNNDYNLVQRNRDEQKLRQFYTHGQRNEPIRAERPEGLFTSLIEGSDKEDL